MNKEIISLIRSTASEIGIDQNLYESICTHESSLNPLAIRFEPAWKYLYFPRESAISLGISIETENVLQACSYGLPQIMGSVCRELGFRGMLTQLISDSKLSLTHGAIHLKNYLQKYGNEVDAISAYNQGSNRKTNGGFYENQKYVDAVSSHLNELRKLKE